MPAARSRVASRTRVDGSPPGKFAIRTGAVAADPPSQPAPSITASTRARPSAAPPAETGPPRRRAGRRRGPAGGPVGPALELLEVPLAADLARLVEGPQDVAPLPGQPEVVEQPVEDLAVVQRDRERGDSGPRQG